MTTLFDILRKTYLSLGHLEVSSATGGSTTYITDTNLGDKYGDDDIVGNTVFIIKAGDAAPEGEVGKVYSYVNSTNVITLTSALTAAVASGDKYGLAKNIIDLETMKIIINDALQGMGTVQLADTSLTTVSGQTEYSIPKALKYKINGVQIQTNTVASNYEWNDIGGWYIVNSAAGSTGLLCFTESLPAGFTLKLLYESEHPEVSLMTDEIAEVFHSDYVTKVVVEKALEYQVRREGGTNDFLLQTSNKAMEDARNAMTRHSQPKHKRPKYLTPYQFGEDDDYEG